jgi:hypothetical protein
MRLSKTTGNASRPTVLFPPQAFLRFRLPACSRLTHGRGATSQSNIHGPKGGQPVFNSCQSTAQAYPCLKPSRRPINRLVANPPLGTRPAGPINRREVSVADYRWTIPSRKGHWSRVSQRDPVRGHRIAVEASQRSSELELARNPGLPSGGISRKLRRANLGKTGGRGACHRHILGRL